MWPFKKKPKTETQWRLRKTDLVGGDYYVLEVQDYIDGPNDWRFVRALTTQEVAVFTNS